MTSDSVQESQKNSTHQVGAYRLNLAAISNKKEKQGGWHSHRSVNSRRSQSSFNGDYRCTQKLHVQKFLNSARDYHSNIDDNGERLISTEMSISSERNQHQGKSHRAADADVRQGRSTDAYGQSVQPQQLRSKVLTGTFGQKQKLVPSQFKQSQSPFNPDSGAPSSTNINEQISNIKIDKSLYVQETSLSSQNVSGIIKQLLNSSSRPRSPLLQGDKIENSKSQEDLQEYATAINNTQSCHQIVSQNLKEQFEQEINGENDQQLNTELLMNQNFNESCNENEQHYNLLEIYEAQQLRNVAMQQTDFQFQQDKAIMYNQLNCNNYCLRQPAGAATLQAHNQWMTQNQFDVIKEEVQNENNPSSFDNQSRSVSYDMGGNQRNHLSEHRHQPSLSNVSVSQPVQLISYASGLSSKVSGANGPSGAASPGKSHGHSYHQTMVSQRTVQENIINTPPQDKLQPKRSEMNLQQQEGPSLDMNSTAPKNYVLDVEPMEQQVDDNHFLVRRYSLGEDAQDTLEGKQSAKQMESHFEKFTQEDAKKSIIKTQENYRADNGTANQKEMFMNDELYQEFQMELEMARQITYSDQSGFRKVPYQECKAPTITISKRQNQQQNDHPTFKTIRKRTPELLKKQFQVKEYKQVLTRKGDYRNTSTEKASDNISSRISNNNLRSQNSTSRSMIRYGSKSNSYINSKSNSKPRSNLNSIRTSGRNSGRKQYSKSPCSSADMTKRTRRGEQPHKSGDAHKNQVIGYRQALNNRGRQKQSNNKIVKGQKTVQKPEINSFSSVIQSSTSLTHRTEHNSFVAKHSSKANQQIPFFPQSQAHGHADDLNQDVCHVLTQSDAPDKQNLKQNAYRDVDSDQQTVGDGQENDEKARKIEADEAPCIRINKKARNCQIDLSQSCAQQNQTDQQSAVSYLNQESFCQDNSHNQPTHQPKDQRATEQEFYDDRSYMEIISNARRTPCGHSNQTVQDQNYLDQINQNNRQSNKFVFNEEPPQISRKSRHVRLPTHNGESSSDMATPYGLIELNTESLSDDTICHSASNAFPNKHTNIFFNINEKKEFMDVIQRQEAAFNNTPSNINSSAHDNKVAFQDAMQQETGVFKGLFEKSTEKYDQNCEEIPMDLNDINYRQSVFSNRKRSCGRQETSTEEQMKIKSLKDSKSQAQLTKVGELNNGDSSPSKSQTHSRMTSSNTQSVTTSFKPILRKEIRQIEKTKQKLLQHQEQYKKLFQSIINQKRQEGRRPYRGASQQKRSTSRSQSKQSIGKMERTGNQNVTQIYDGDSSLNDISNKIGGRARPNSKFTTKTQHSKNESMLSQSTSQGLTLSQNNNRPRGCDENSQVNHANAGTHSTIDHSTCQRRAPSIDTSLKRRKSPNLCRNTSKSATLHKPQPARPKSSMVKQQNKCALGKDTKSLAKKGVPNSFRSRASGGQKSPNSQNLSQRVTDRSRSGISNQKPQQRRSTHKMFEGKLGVNQSRNCKGQTDRTPVPGEQASDTVQQLKREYQKIQDKRKKILDSLKLSAVNQPGTGARIGSAQQNSYRAPLS